MSIRVLYHSSIKISDGKILYFDPYMIKNDEHDADYIFITHDHYDHFSPSDIEKIIKRDTIIFAPFSLKNQLSEKNAIFLNPTDSFSNDFIEVYATHAYNISKKFHPKENLWNGYIVTLNSIKYYVMGDTDFNEDIKNIVCDVVFVPVGGTYTMDFKGAASFVNLIKPRLAVPTHFGSVAGNITDGESFKKLLSKNIKCEIITEEF